MIQNSQGEKGYQTTYLVRGWNSGSKTKCRKKFVTVKKKMKVSLDKYTIKFHFLKAVFEELNFGGAYSEGLIYRGKFNCVSKSIGLNLPFLLCFTLYLREIFQVQAPGGHIF